LTSEDIIKKIDMTDNYAQIVKLVVDGKTKYQFCNIPSVKNYPHKLKNVTSAMNVLFAHERGWIAYNKNK